MLASPRTALVASLLIGASVAAAVARGPLRQDPAHDHPGVALQPFAVQVRRLITTLEYLGQPLPEADRAALERAAGSTDEHAGVAAMTRVLDRHVLVAIDINPESRVKAAQGAATPALVQGGTRVFLVKVVNQAGVTAPLRVRSPQSGKVSIPSWTSRGAPDPPRTISDRDIAERWADITLYEKPPMAPALSGLALEYRILEVYSRDAGQRAAEMSFDVGQGTQDIGFRADVAVLFTAAPARSVTIRVEDEKGKPAVAGLVVRDQAGRLYPAPSKRLAPDFPFQPHVYRSDGESLLLPDGRYEIRSSGGPEYHDATQAVTVSASGPDEVWVRLERWIDPEARGWYSGDHHIHAAGCSHYQDPAQGVGPEDMMRQVRGEGLNIGAVLTWGPCYYHQKRYFSGDDHPLSTSNRLLHYDVEVSGFPSSHAGHLVLMGLTDQDYPDTRRLEDWPTWTLPILRWARAQGAVTGYAHSGWGLQIAARDLPAAEVPAFDGIGANEFIVAVTHPETVDFISAVDTPWPWELNIWYHVLNAGFRTRISGETDFPCIYDDRVGLGRTYAKLDRLTYRNWLDAVRAGRTYVSDGRSHLMDFAVNGVAAGSDDVRVARGGRLTASVDVAAWLDEQPATDLSGRPADEKPYWDVERSRIAGTRDVSVEFLVNGRVAATRRVAADGTVRRLEVDLPLERSAWIAARILPSSHTNPAFVVVDEKPMRPVTSSVRWCLEAVDRCWRQKSGRIRESERAEAEAAYEHARRVYRERLAQGVDR